MATRQALFQAVIDADLPPLRTWLSQGRHPDDVRLYGVTLLHAAAAENHVAVVDLLLAAGADPNTASDTQRRPLDEAVDNRPVHPRLGRARPNPAAQLQIATTLLDAGADPNPVPLEPPVTLKAMLGFDLPLNHAARVNAVPLMALLLARGAALDGPNPPHTGYAHATALWCAATKGHLEAVDFLLRAGARPDAPTHNGNTALLNAIYGPGRSPSVRRRAEVAALHARFAAIIDRLIAGGADVNCPDGRGFTALNAAVNECNPAYLQTVLDAGADVGHRTDAGDPILCFLVKRQRSRELPQTKMAALVAPLRAAGADVDAQDAAGDTALDLARRHRARPLIKALSA